MSAPGALALLGNTLKGKDGDVSVTSIVGPGKVVGLYFSAHWCPPCRGFTPVLGQFYTSFKAGHPRKDDLEIVFVSSDRDPQQFSDYHGSMPFLALPFESRDAKAKLSQKFKVQGIPTLVFVDGESGELITSGGREAVTSDPQAKEFPWKPKPFSEVLTGDLVYKDGSTVPADKALGGKIKMLYFSAHWCPPCRAFTPELVKWYSGMKAAGKHDFELVFVSSDRDEASFKEYLSEMPWPALPLAERGKKQALSNMFEVDGIPTLLVLDKDGKLITKSGRGAVSSDPEGKDFPWAPRPLDRLSDLTTDLLNEGPVAVLFGAEDMEGEALKARAEELLLKTAEATKAGSEPDSLSFLFAPQSDPLAARVADFVHLELDGEPEQLVLLDIPGQEVHFCKQKGAQLTAAVAEAWLESFKAGKLKGNPLRG